MLRPAVPVMVAILAGCTQPRTPAGPEVASASPVASAQYEAAPVVRAIDYDVSPDMRERICGQPQERGGSFATVTKAVGDFCH